MFFINIVDALTLVGSPVLGFPIELLYTKEQFEQEQARWAVWDTAIQERDRPAMVDALMQDPTLVPFPNYPAARQRVRNNLSESSFASVLDPLPGRTSNPQRMKDLPKFRCRR